MSTRHSSMLDGYASWALYGLLVSLRLSFVIFHSSGYLHPDEYFQSIELAAHDIYANACSLLAWEFQFEGHGPVRSRSSIYPVVHLPIKVANHLFPIVEASHLSGSDFVDRLLLPARLTAAILSFIPDAFVFYLSRNLGSKKRRDGPLALLLYSSMAYGGLLWNTRTLSNIWETAAVSSFCYLSLHSISLLALIIQALIAGWAVFLRPTFPIFVLPFIMLQLFNMIRSTRCFRNIFFYIPLGLLAAGAMATLLAYLDTQYYTKLKLVSSSNLIVAPIRFFIYNSAEETLSEHGLHPWYHYIVIHWPLMLSPLLALFAIIPPSCNGSNDSLRYTTWFSVVFATIVFSLIGHKETRFLLPSLPFAITLAALRARRLKSLLILWVTYQAILVIFWGLVHQAGILAFMRSLPAADVDDVSLNIFYRTYMPPRFAFGKPASSLPSVPLKCRELVPSNWSQQCTRVVDFAGSSEATIIEFLDCVKTYSPNNTVVRIVSLSWKCYNLEANCYLPSKIVLNSLTILLSTFRYFPELCCLYKTSSANMVGSFKWTRSSHTYPRKIHPLWTSQDVTPTNHCNVFGISLKHNCPYIPTNLSYLEPDV